MHLIKKAETEADISKETEMLSVFGTSFTPDELSRAERLEVWGTSFSDVGSDYTEFRLFKDGKPFASRRVDGY